MYPRAPYNTPRYKIPNMFKADVFEQSCSLVEILSSSKCIKEYPDRFEEFALTGKTVHQYRSKFNRDVPSIRTEGEKWENWGWAPACGILRNGALGERRIVNTLKEASSVCPSSASAPTQSSRGLAEEEVTIYQSGISSTNTLSQNLGKESKVGRAHFQV